MNRGRLRDRWPTGPVAARTGRRPPGSPQTLVHRSGATSERLIALQATAGNAAVQRLLDLAAQRRADDPDLYEVRVPAPPLTGRGEPAEVEVEGGCDGLTLHGQANARFNGGRWSVVGQKLTTSDACGHCGPPQCLHLTGTLVTNYSVAVTITMPGVPAGLTGCEAAQVRAFLRNVLLPHEQDHRRRFKTYEGRTRNPLDLTGCGMADLRSQIAAIQAAEDGPRQAAANALSGAIDPFVQVVDCSDCGD